jgi:hypothetical protein
MCVSGIAQCIFFEKFDADGDGRVDFSEFQNMIKISRKAANFFTGNEKLERLTDEQMTAFLLFEGWPKAHVGPGVYERQSHKHGGHEQESERYRCVRGCWCNCLRATRKQLHQHVIACSNMVLLLYYYASTIANHPKMRRVREEYLLCCIR